MSTDQTIFGNNQPNNAPTSASPSAGASAQNDNPFATLLGGIKNEHGVQKFKSPEELANGYVASQQFIQTLMNEKAEAERRLQEATRIAEEKQSQLASQDELRRTVEELTRKANDSAPTSAGIKPEDIAALVRQSLTAEQQAAEAKKNQIAVANAMKAKFGDKAEEVYNSLAEANGFSVSDLNSLAAKSATAALKLLGVDTQAKPQTFAPGGSAVNSAALTPAENSMIKRNTRELQIGATTSELNEEAKSARAMVDELHSQGLTIDDITKPSVYFKLFK